MSKPLATVGVDVDPVDLHLAGYGYRGLPPDSLAYEPALPRLLAAFDPYLLGWKDRSFAVPAEHARRVHPGGGVLRAVATIDGLVVGTWSARRRVELEPFGPIEETAFRAEIEDVARFSGG